MITVILLCLVKLSRWRSGGFGDDSAVERPEELTGEISLEDASDLSGCSALGATTVNVGPGIWVVRHAGDHGHVEGAVQTAVAATIQAVAHSVARRRRDRIYSGQRRKGCLVA